MAEPQRLRLFIAIELPEAIRDALSNTIDFLREELPGGYRWVAPRSIHLTLKFLGDRPADEITALADALSSGSAAVLSFELGLEGAGTFPNERSPKVIWAGLGGGTEALGQLRDAMEGAMVEAGQAPEPRAFLPHLTLARVRDRLSTGDAQRLHEVLSGVSFTEQARFDVREVSLMRSELGPQGTRYTALARAPLISRS